MWLTRRHHKGENGCHDNFGDEFADLFIQVHVEKVVSCHLVGVVESFNQGHSQINCEDCFKLVSEAVEDSTKYERRSILAKSLLLKLVTGGVRQSILVGGLFELSQEDLWQSRNLFPTVLDFLGQLDVELL